ncbi:MAG TPA: methyltransferase domain-containing protein [Candidatus Brocadiia bacterium]|nr:methyltransferase domain-containing protein [Planctomycetota bacterium]MDO8094245.1 methyltransferase domain-containing protein [Candidatus Brocadiales bacterium]
MEILRDVKLYVPDFSIIERNGLHVLIDGDTPNWVATGHRGIRIIDYIRFLPNLNGVITSYANEFSMDTAKAWLHVDTFLKDALRYKFVSPEPIINSPYSGRADFIKPEKLNELWIHTNNNCNLTCSHCLVNSSTGGDKGLPTKNIKSVIDNACMLGVNRFYITGGEPFVRDDMFELLHYITEKKQIEVAVLTNGTLLGNGGRNGFLKLNSERIKIQISLDGSKPEINDAVRGKGSFEQILKGIKYTIKAGFSPTVTTTVTSQNADDVPAITRLIAALGIKNHHLLWLHNRGRAATNPPRPPFSRGGVTPPLHTLIDTLRAVKEAAKESGILIDNYESLKMRLNSQRGTRYDLSNACYDSLCIYSNGEAYPSASLAGYKGLYCGNILKEPLEDIWQKSPVSKLFHNATLQRKGDCVSCRLRFLCGGGDIEHSYLYTKELHGADPYCALYKEMIADTLVELTEEKRRVFNAKSGFNAPVIFKAMGEGGLNCGLWNADCRIIPNSELRIPHSVRTLHSNCVLSFDVDRARQVVRTFYGRAAKEPQSELCCPTSYQKEDTSHIPQDVLDRFYGCGSPMSIAGVTGGEMVVDLGSGGGIDCFIAAKKVGSNGKVIGIDMTDEMLEIANKNNKLVAKRLGFNVVEFRKGFLEEIPIADRTMDLITSNCVINLSPDKKAVFREMWRILKDNGRVVVSDIVSEGEVPPHLKVNEKLWGECMGGALTEEEFISYLEQAGFYGLQVLQKVFWKEVDVRQGESASGTSCKFFSVTIRGYKFEKKAGCTYIGQYAIYRGPFKAVMDEEGHLFPRNEAVEVCTDTALKLQNPPYKGLFIVTDHTKDIEDGYSCCTENSEGCC